MKKPLKDKVALLFDGSRAAGCSMAVLLAKLGADVAIVYQEVDAEQAQYTKERVEAEDQDCLIMPLQFVDDAFSEEVVRQTIEALGKLDIFIDYSSQDRNNRAPNNSAPALQRGATFSRESPLANVEIMSAALDQMFNIGPAKGQAYQDFETGEDKSL